MKHKILGDDLQAILISLEPGESVMAEAGAMLYMTDGVEMETRLGAGGAENSDTIGKLWKGAKRMLAGDSLFMTVCTAHHQAGAVGFSAPNPGKIIELNLSETGPMLCQRSAFLCAETTVDMDIAFTKRFGAGLFGGEGFILQKLTGPGQAFAHAGGMVFPLELKPGQTLRVDTGCLAAMSASIDYDIRLVKGVKTALFGGEGLFFAHLAGPGKVYLQSMPLNRLADRLVSASGLGGVQTRGPGGLAGKIFGTLLGGD
ncbi:MAG: TIGR00266 family protein [Vampirovibrionales bacterium]|nr:TIGR00266 family protein [Vampirovibrionales bacterium]